MSWTLRSNLHTLDTVITPPSESSREERVSTRATLQWEMSCFMLRGAWAATLMPVWNSDQPSCWQKLGDAIWWCRGPESKGCRVARKVTNQFRCWHLGSQRHRCKRGPSLALQFIRPNARCKLQFRIIRNSTNWAEKPRRDQRCNSIRLIQGCVQFLSLNGISEDGI